jgi:hypothetical protein
MIYKTTYVSDNNERIALEELFGMFNDFPPGWTELTTEEFAKSQLVNGAIAHVEFRQMMRPKELLEGKQHHMNGQLYHTGNGLGYSIITQFWDGTVRFFKFDCLPKINDEFTKLPMVSDYGWEIQSSSIPRRGIMDYQRTIEFARALTEREVELVRMYLARDNCPGWTGIGYRYMSNNTYTFNTTHDSSD